MSPAGMDEGGSGGGEGGRLGIFWALILPQVLQYSMILPVGTQKVSIREE